MARTARAAQIWGLRLGLVALVVGAWLYATGPGGVSRLILPPLPEVVAEFVGLFSADWLGEALLVTVTEIVLAFLLASVVGLLAGYLLSRTSLRARAAEPALAWGYMFPLVLLYPIFLLWMGVGMSSKIVYAAVAASIPIAYNTVRGLSAVEPVYLRVGTAFGASRRDIDVHIKTGAAWPMILGGIRIGISLVLISVILAELLGANVGLGFELQRATNTLQNARGFAIIAAILIVTATLQFLLERAVSSVGRSGR